MEVEKDIDYKIFYIVNKKIYHKTSQNITSSSDEGTAIPFITNKKLLTKTGSKKLRTLHIINTCYK